MSEYPESQKPRQKSGLGLNSYKKCNYSAYIVTMSEYQRIEPVFPGFGKQGCFPKAYRDVFTASPEIQALCADTATWLSSYQKIR